MNIKNDLVAKRIYFKLSEKEWTGLQVAIDIIRDVFPKIDLYQSILRDGDYISLGKGPAIDIKGRKRGSPLFIVTKPKAKNLAHIKIRMDSAKDKKIIEHSMNQTWKELQENKFIFSDYQSHENKFRAFLEKLKNDSTVANERASGSAMYPSDYDEPTSNPTENEADLWEGSTVSVRVNKYERNKLARKKCIEHYGSKCYICNFDFGEKYGAKYSGFIHIHHIVPISKIKKEYVVDPIKDLIPVCPNCHSVIHFSDDVLSIDDIKK